MVSLRWFYIYLFILSKLKGLSKKKDHYIATIDSSKLINASGSILLKKESLILIEKLRQEQALNNEDFRFINLLFEESKKSFPRLTILKDIHGFKGILDEEFLEGLCSDESKVLSALNSGLSELRQISPGWYKKAKKVLEVVAGVESDHNLINSGFTRDFPGFINFNINCDPTVIGEQLAHETTHLMLDNKLQFDDLARKFIKSVPPVFSIFAKKPRSAELVVHGLFSYSSVYIYWKGIAKRNKKDSNLAKKRMKEVEVYLQRAIVDLDNVLTPYMWRRLFLIYKEICPLAESVTWSQSKIPKVDIQRFITRLKEYLNNIEIAELILAIEGNKVSRISMRVQRAENFMEILNSLPIYYCFSNYLFKSSEDENLDGFRNVITSIHDLDSFLDEELEIHIYFANSREKLKKAFLLDQEDKCAPLFKTPSCCEDFFLKNWENCVAVHKGDMTRLYAQNALVALKTNPLYNSVGMYFGLGFCWHFPCKLDCKKTKRVVHKRMKILKKYNSIYDELAKIKRYKIFCDSHGQYSLIKT